MEIKNVRQFREIYKRVVRSTTDANRNEHFIGNRKKLENGEEVFGFFELYHGDKEGYGNADGIRGYLEGFLDMAKDGQAVYEFLQNAVDAKSTKFFLHWGKDEVDGNTYLLLANNGDPFDVKGIRSILNIGVSTKAGDGYTIGKFGIGFKLAHRLVGKENGLDELIYHNYGPILFSWANRELENFKPEVSHLLQPVDQRYEEDRAAERKTVKCLDNHPWLFKILITNFPCQPENSYIPERILDYQYQVQENAFSKTEVEAMARWIDKYRVQFAQDFEKGALFFLRLGQGKESHLEEENLAEGVRFSVAILNRLAERQLGHPGLQEVILGKDRLQPVPLDFESFVIPKVSNEYRMIRFGKTEGLEPSQLEQEKKDADIEILFGYTDYQRGAALFRNAPNFYLFFPLSEEKHRFRFIIQCNAFHKASSRTYLQKGSGGAGVNERIFAAFTKKLSDLLWNYSLVSDSQANEKFLQIYANLLLSNPSSNPERQWVNQPLWEPLLGLLKQFLPIKTTVNRPFGIRQNGQIVFVKQSKFPLEKMLGLLNQKAWFYWDKPEDADVQSEAVSKLSLKRFNVVHLIGEPGNAPVINKWLEVQTPEVVESFIKEIEDYYNSEQTSTPIFKEQFAALKIWQFEDGRLSINELINEGVQAEHILLFEQVDPFENVLKNSGFQVSRISISAYKNLGSFIRLRYQSELSYIRDTRNLVRTLNNKFKDANLAPADKHLIVRSLAHDLSSDKTARIETVRELTIYKNRLGKVLPLKAILPENTKHTWLSGWSITQSEVNANLLADYFCSGEEEIYKHVIHAYWSDISATIAPYGRFLCYQFLIDNYVSGYPDFSGLPFVLVNGHFLDAGADFYYNPSLDEVNGLEFLLLSNTLIKLGVPTIPDKQLLSFYPKEPFKLYAKELNLNPSEEQLLTFQEVDSLLSFCQKVKVEVFEQVVFQAHLLDQSKILLRTIGEGENQVVISNDLLASYVSQFSDNSFFTLPPKIQHFAKLGALTEDQVIAQEIEDLRVADQPTLARKIALLNALRTANEDQKRAVLGAISRIDAKITNVEECLLLKVFLEVLVSTQLSVEEKIMMVRDRLVLHDTESGLAEILLSEIDLIGRDEIIFSDGLPGLSVASVLQADPAAETNALIARLISILVSENLTKETLEKIFGLEDEQDKLVILEKLFESTPILETSEQVAFVMRYAAIEELADIPEFKVNDLLSQARDLCQDWYLQNFENKFIPPQYRLHTCYDNLNVLLNLDKRAFFFEVNGKQCSVNGLPRFTKGVLHLPGISQISAEQQQHELFIWLWLNWKEDEAPKVIIPNEVAWKNLIGFDPHHCIVSDTDLVVSSEKLPHRLTDKFERTTGDSITDTKVMQFLKALGVACENNPIICLRKRLFYQEEHKIELSEIDSQLLENTLALLVDREWEGDFDNKLYVIVEDIFEKLFYDSKDWKLPKIILKDSGSNLFSLKYVDQVYGLDNLQELKDYSLTTDEIAGILDRGVAYRYYSKEHEELEVLKFSDEIDSFLIDQRKRLWSAKFYQSLRISHPEIEIFEFPGRIPRLLLANGQQIKCFERGDFISLNKQVIVSSYLNDARIIELLDSNKLLPEEYLSALKHSAQQFEEEFASIFKKIIADPERKRLFEKMEEEARVEEEREQRIQELNTTEKYTYYWFENLIALMLKSDQAPTQNEGSISFSSLFYEDDDRRLIRFGGASRLVSTKIEVCTDFKAIIRYRKDGKVKILESKIRGISKKGNDILALPVDPFDYIDISEKDVLQVELSFVRVIDLIRRLQTAFEELDINAETNLKDTLSPMIDFIFGPPGTGKTTTIAKKVIKRVIRGKTKRTLILTPTNKAADVLTKKILSIADEKGDNSVENWLVRYGTANDLSLIDRQIVYNSTDFQIDLYDTCVVVSTIHRYPYDKVLKRTGEEQVSELLRSEDWDTIMFDEASMIPLAYIVYVLTHRKFRQNSEDLTRFIIGGDPFQLPPVVDLSHNTGIVDKNDLEHETIYKMIDLRSFVPEQQRTIPIYGERIKNLTTQYRAIESIGQLYSEFQYEGLLSHGRIESKGGNHTPRPLPKFFRKHLGFKPITVIRYPVNDNDSLFDPKKIGGSPYQLFVSFLVNELVKRFKEECGNEKWDIGVVSPYRAQATLIQKMLESQEPSQNVSVLTDTVHGFQGDERDLMFVVLNPSSLEVSWSRFLKEQYILNVAISRARDYLVLLIPDKHSKGINNLPLIHEDYANSLLNLINKYSSIGDVSKISSEEVEKVLFGEQDYFLDNSFTNAHQVVNIYGRPEMRYMVRIGKDAIDVNWER